MAVQTQILHRRDTAANWTSTNPVLGAGELGFETNTTKFKIGDGTTAWASLNYYVSSASPTFTGTPLSTTAAVDTNTTQIATTAYVVGQGYAKLASPTFTGTPTLPTGTIATTQTALDSTTKVATTAFVTTADNLKANLASPTFTGTPTLPTGTIATTQTAGNSTTALATTAFVTTADNLKANLISPSFTTPALGVATATSVNGTTIPSSKTLVVTTDKLSVHAATTSAELAGVISDETGTGSLVFSASPALTGTPTAPTAAAGTNNTQLATTAFANNAGGLVFIKSQTIGTAVASVAVTSAFSTTYDSYKIIISGVSCSVSAEQLRFALTGQSTATYGSFYYDRYTAVSPTTDTIRSSAASFTPIAMTNGTGSTSCDLTINAPFTATRTTMSGNFGGEWSGFMGALWTDTTSYTGFTLTTTSGTITGGTIAIYGFRKA